MPVDPLIFLRFVEARRHLEVKRWAQAASVAGKYPPTGQISFTLRHHLDKLYLHGEGVEWMFMFRVEMAATEQDRAGRNRSAFEDLLLLLTSAFSPLFSFRS